MFVAANRQGTRIVLKRTMTIEKKDMTKWLAVVFAAGLLTSFFLPWVCWKEHAIRGYYMSTGKFFDISGSQFSMSNPVPELSFTFYLLWLIPVLSVLVIYLILNNKRFALPALIASAVTLGLLTIFFLFTYKDLAVETNVVKVLQPAGYLALVSAVGLILTITPPFPLYKKTGALLVGPLFAFISHILIEKKFMSETYNDTDKAKADYTVTATGLINEFMANDSLANKKYREKIVTVSGAATEIEMQGDSTANIKFTDSTGSYIIFPMEKDVYDKTSKLKPGNTVSLKGSCSGSVYSDILGTTSISFKRTTFNKQ